MPAAGGRVRMTKADDIPFRSIPHQSSLFLNYIECAPEAVRFYRCAPTLENLEAAAREIPAGFPFPRKELGAILRRQNELFGSGRETFENIDNLERPDCAAILTGQQVGLFTGPLYTVYKALTAVHLAAELGRRGIRAVPVFWMETEDHDLPEATRRTIREPDGSLGVRDYAGMLFAGTGAPRGSVGAMRFPESIREVVRDFVDHLPDGTCRQEVQRQLESAYRPGASFAGAFGRLLAQLMLGTGLVLFDPRDAEAKRLVRPVFQRAVRGADAIREALLQRGRDLEAGGFHAQVNVLENSTVLFYLQDGDRCSLEKSGTGFVLKNSGHRLTGDTLLRHAGEYPERFSPNVVLRPVLQDYLFPTAAYAGGSAEVAYFAQAQVVYAHMDRPMPVVWPRNSFSLLEPEIGEAMARTGVGMQDCFQGKPFVLEKLLRRSGAAEAVSNLEALRQSLDRGLTELRPAMQAVDPTLVRALETARRKILHNAERLRSHALRLEGMSDSLIPRTADLLLNHCYPNRKLQERELGIQHFWVRHGASLLDAIRASLEVECFDHRVLQL